MPKKTISAHDELVKAAEWAIEEVFSDTSVSRGKTRDSLNDLVSMIEMKLASLGDE